MVILHKNLCCGCEACAAICQTGAIKMQLDDEGFWYPEIHEQQCVHCDLCRKVCPVINAEETACQTHDLHTLAGYVTEEQELRSCASGGAATAISRSFIRHGGIVFGTEYAPDFYSALYSYVETESELDRYKNSKYFQCRKGPVFTQIKNFLEHGKSVLLIGLPCKVAAVKRFLRKDFDMLYTVELICHGPTSEKVNREFIEKIEAQYGSKVTAFSVRAKEQGWTPPFLKAAFANGSVFCRPFYETEYGIAFAEMSRPSCYDCAFKGNRRAADLTIGDYWGADSTLDCWNPNGVSLLCVHNSSGQALLDQTENFRMFEADEKRAKIGNPCIDYSRQNTGRRKRFSTMLIKNGLFSACEHRYPLAFRLRIILSGIFHALIQYLHAYKK